jgi:hypothetical protein
MGSTGLMVSINQEGSVFGSRGTGRLGTRRSKSGVGEGVQSVRNPHGPAASETCDGFCAVFMARLPSVRLGLRAASFCRFTIREAPVFLVHSES